MVDIKTRKCFKKSGDEWRSVVDGSIVNQLYIKYLIKEFKDKEKAIQSADCFLVDISKYLN